MVDAVTYIILTTGIHTFFDSVKFASSSPIMKFFKEMTTAVFRACIGSQVTH